MVESSEPESSEPESSEPEGLGVLELERVELVKLIKLLHTSSSFPSPGSSGVIIS
jgi:hypothetical protein